ncbi:MAG: hypothetical protein MI924_24965 [Chloroflexales bacterium]|nr:hypothetical protein [Chloroflexales bacterium]
MDAGLWTDLTVVLRGLAIIARVGGWHCWMPLLLRVRRGVTPAVTFAALGVLIAQAPAAAASPSALNQVILALVAIGAVLIGSEVAASSWQRAAHWSQASLQWSRLARLRCCGRSWICRSFPVRSRAPAAFCPPFSASKR